MTVRIETKDNRLNVYSPYNPDLPSEARKLGGKWNKKCWVFDARDEQRVKELYTSIYGTCGDDSQKGDVAIRIHVGEDPWYSERCSGLYAGPIQLGRAFGRDSGAKLSDNVVVLNGEIGSGGSAKNWHTIAIARTIIEIRDLTDSVANKVLAELENDCYVEANIVGKDKRDALIAEREQLLKRIHEIEAILNEKTA